MFIDRINAPISPLTSSVVGKLRRLTREPDYSLTCLAYALLKSRDPNYHGVDGLIGSTASLDNLVDILNSRKNKPAADNMPCLIYLTWCVDSNTQVIIDRLKETGLTELTQVNAFVKQSIENAEIHALIDKDTDTAIVFASTGDLSVYHLTIAFFAALFPRLFENKPLVKEEIDMLKSLTAKTSHKFATLVSKQLDFAKKDILKCELAECFKGFREGKIRVAEDNVQKLEQMMDQMLNEFRKYSEQRESAVVILEGLKAVQDDTSEQEMEAVDYIASCPRLHDVTYTNGVLSFNVSTFLTNFDVAKWRRVVSSRDIYSGFRIPTENPFAIIANRKVLLDALFNSDDPELTVRMRAHFNLYVNRNYMDVNRGDDFNNCSEEITNSLTNPHFKYHGCPGQNRDQIVSCLRQGDIISALECCIAATGSVNIGETEITFRPFVQTILTSTDKIIRRADGVNMTPAEALLWLLNKQGDKVA